MNSASVDLIYLDPPFNSNRHYEAPIGSKAAGASFRDAWTLDDVDVCEHGELADRNPAAYSVIEAACQAHGKGMQSYLIFMAVRLLEMHRILNIERKYPPALRPDREPLPQAAYGCDFREGEIPIRNRLETLQPPQRIATQGKEVRSIVRHDAVLRDGRVAHVPSNPCAIEPDRGREAVFKHGQEGPVYERPSGSVGI